MLDIVFTGPVSKSNKRKTLSHFAPFNQSSCRFNVVFFFIYAFMIIFSAFVVMHYVYIDSLCRENHNCVLDMGHQSNCLHRTWYKVINGRHFIIILLPSPNQAADFSSLCFIFYIISVHNVIIIIFQNNNQIYISFFFSFNILIILGFLQN